MNKQGYVLIEILISIIILSFTTLTLLKINFDQKRLYEISDKKLYFSKYSTIILNSHSIDLHNKDINLYDFLKRKYDIKNQSLIKTAKKIKINYRQKYKSIIKFKNDTEDFNLLIDEITLSSKEGRSRYLTVKE